MSLQRRRERYVIMHMWKILHGLTSNDLQVQFTVNPRLGNLAKVPSFLKKLSAAHQTLYETSLWALSCGTVYLPKYVQPPNMIASSAKRQRSCFLCRTNRQFGASLHRIPTLYWIGVTIEKRLGWSATLMACRVLTKRIEGIEGKVNLKVITNTNLN